MNFDMATAVGFVAVAACGFVLGAIVGRGMLGEIHALFGALESRVAALEHSVMGHGSNSAPAAHTAVAVDAHAAALDHHAGAVGKLAGAVEKHARAIDDHGAATVAAAVELSAHQVGHTHPAHPIHHAPDGGVIGAVAAAPATASVSAAEAHQG